MQPLNSPIDKMCPKWALVCAHVDLVTSTGGLTPLIWSRAPKNHKVKNYRYFFVLFFLLTSRFHCELGLLLANCEQIPDLRSKRSSEGGVEIKFYSKIDVGPLVNHHEAFVGWIEHFITKHMCCPKFMLKSNGIENKTKHKKTAKVGANSLVFWLPCVLFVSILDSLLIFSYYSCNA